MNNITYRVNNREEAEAIGDFFWSLRDEFHFSERETVDEITGLLFEHGGVISGYGVDGNIVGAVGYFFGEPSKDYANKDVGFIYLAGLDRSVRHSDAFGQGWRYLVEAMDGYGVHELRWHVREDDAANIALYDQLGQHICPEVNRRGYSCNLYGTTVAEAQAEIERRRHT